MPYANTYETVQVEVVGAPPTAFTVSIYVLSLIRVRLFGFISVPYVKLTINGEEVKADSSGVAVVYLDKGVEYLLKAEHWLIDTLEQTIGPFTYDTSIDVYALPSLLLWLLITGGVSGITYLASGSKRATIVIGVATFIMWPAMKYLPELVKTCLLYTSPSPRD